MHFLASRREPCRRQAKETVTSVMLGAFMYTLFRLYRNFEDEIVPLSSLPETYLAKSLGAAVFNYLFSIYHFTASFKCLPAFIAIVQIFRMNRQAKKEVKIRSAAADVYAFYLIVGMVLCAGGDYWLEIDTCKDDVVVHEFMNATHSPLPPFIIGLVSFLLGHIAFIMAFYSDGGNGGRWSIGLCLYAYAVVIVYIIMKFGSIRDNDIVLKIGIVAYSAVIATMCHRSFSLSLDAYPGLESSAYAVLGSLTFLVSDSLLAYNRFVAPIPLGRISTLITYFLALGLIASSAAGSTRWKMGWD